jgi:hypothetical protein
VNELHIFEGEFAVRLFSVTSTVWRMRVVVIVYTVGAQVILRVLSSCRSVWPAASVSREQALYCLLRKHC